VGIDIAGDQSTIQSEAGSNIPRKAALESPRRCEVLFLKGVLNKPLPDW
jgi:hypothetical protein